MTPTDLHSQSSGFGACGTFLWTGTPARSMYRCFPQPTIISMNDEPQAVIDASTSTTSSTSSTSTSSSTPTQTTPPPDGDDKPSTNTGAIVGGVVGGVAGIALIASLAAWLILRHRRSGKKAQTYNAVSTEPSNPHTQQPSPQMAQLQQYPGGYQAVPGSGPTTFPPTSPYPTSVSTATAYDPRGSYYDPSKSPGQVSQQPLFPGQPASPPVPVAGAYNPNPHHSIMSELDAPAVSGTRGNPVEIGDK